jgi:hypothetical protein
LGADSALHRFVYGMKLMVAGNLFNKITARIFKDHKAAQH